MSAQRAWTAINRPIVVINLLHFKNATKSLWQNLLLASMRALWLVLASLASAQDAEEGCCSDDLTRDAVESNAVESCGTDQLTRGAAATTTTRATPTAQPGAWDIAPSVLIQPGEFRMGTDRPRIFVDGEAPSRRVALSRAFLMDVYEATNDDFAAFVDATGYVTDSERFGWSFVFHLELSEARRAAIDKAVDGVEWWLPVNGSDWRSPQGPGSDVFAAKRGAHPVVQVSWHDAAAYCAWRGGRLPTEAEWEYAARDGRSQTMYPWGNELTPGGAYRANLWQGDFPRSNTADDGFSFAGPVGSYAPQTATGLHDLIGNVWEWVSDWWYEPEAAAHDAVLRDPAGPSAGDEKLKKGGSFLCHKSYCFRYRSAARHKNSPDSASSNNGMRCVRDAAA